MENKKPETLTLQQIQSKLEYYCAYQERCYKEVEQKIQSYTRATSEKEQLLLHLIAHNFINEERFAKSFVRGKHNYKFWGKNRIINELKFRGISSKIIEIALKELPIAVYLNNFHTLAEKNWENLKAPKGQKKNKKFVDFLLRKGCETHLIFEKLNELENQ